MVTDVAFSDDVVMLAAIAPVVNICSCELALLCLGRPLTSHCDLYWSNCLTRKVLGKTHHTNTIHTRLWNCYGVLRRCGVYASTGVC